MAHDMLSKIRGLLTKAENPACTEAEAIAFYDKAQELMAKHSFDMHQVGLTSPNKREGVVKVQMFKDDTRTLLIKAKRELLNYLAHLNHCRSVMVGRQWMDLWGHPSDIEMVQMMFNSIMLQLQTMMMAAERAGAGSDRSWRVNYAHGYVRRVYSRLKAAQDARNTAAASTGTDLVLADRTAVVVSTMNDGYAKLGQSRKVSDSVDPWSSGYQRGTEDGNRANLGGNAVTSSGPVRKELS